MSTADNDEIMKSKTTMYLRFITGDEIKLEYGWLTSFINSFKN